MFNFLYNFLFIDQDKKQLSHTKFWSNIGYGVMCYTFTYAVMYGTNVEETIWFLFGVVVVGNRTLGKYINERGKKTE